jgi:hypothetical protein
MNKQHIIRDGSKGVGVASEKRWSLTGWLRSLRWHRSRQQGDLAARPKPRSARSSKRKDGDIYPLY